MTNINFKPSWAKNGAKWAAISKVQKYEIREGNYDQDTLYYEYELFDYLSPNYLDTTRSRNYTPTFQWLKENELLCVHHNLNYGSQTDFWFDIQKPFVAMLKYDGYGRGRSAAVFNWKGKIIGWPSDFFTELDNLPEISFPMRMSGIDKMIQNDMLYGREIEGLWTIVKQGANYGIECVEVYR